MKKTPKTEKLTAEVPSTEGNLPATLFDQLVVINAALRKEMGIPPDEIASQPKMQIPAWCGNIIRQLGKTVFKPIHKLHPQGKVDWRNYGRIVGMVERYKAFLVHDVPRIVEEELGEVTEEQWRRIEPQLGLDKLRAHLIKVLNRPVAADEPLEKLADEVIERQLQNLEKHRQTAVLHLASQSAKTVAVFYKGVAEGCGSFLDERAKFCGDRGRTNIHLTLLCCMMEVEKLRRTQPPTTRPRYYDSLTKVFNLTPAAYDWFNDVCDDIKFPLNNLGRPRQSPAPIH